MKDSKLVIVGTPETILIEIKKYINMGVTYFTLCFPDLPDTRSLQLFAEHIIHHFKTSSSQLPPNKLLRKFMNDPIKTLMDIAHTYGDICYFKFGRQHIYLLNNPDYIEGILSQKLIK